MHHWRRDGAVINWICEFSYPSSLNRNKKTFISPAWLDQNTMSCSKTFVKLTTVNFVHLRSMIFISYICSQFAVNCWVCHLLLINLEWRDRKYVFTCFCLSSALPCRSLKRLFGSRLKCFKVLKKTCTRKCFHSDLRCKWLVVMITIGETPKVCAAFYQTERINS